MPYVEFHLNWTGQTDQERADQERTRTVEDYYWHYDGASGLLFSALYYPSALEICRYNFGRNLLDFGPSEGQFDLRGPALLDFINFALNAQAVVSEGHLRDGDWLIPFQNNDSAVLRRDQWERVEPGPDTPPLLSNIGLYRYLGSDTPEWVLIVRDFLREQAAFATLARQKLDQGLSVWVSKTDQRV